MKKVLFSIGITSYLLTASCQKDNNNVNPNPSPTPTDSIISIKGDITTDLKLTANNKYRIEGFVFVKNGATLDIEPGTIIMGDKASKGTLIITPSGKINANGTVEKPIVFTSAYAPGLRNTGDWGGIILLGKAPVNVDGGSAKIEGGVIPTDAGKEKEYIWYGGTEVNHNSGILKYVRIEFAGIAYSPDNEVNSLTMAGIGKGTTISHIQVYKAGDDAYEWFGGTVDCDHLIANYTVDDDFDSDLGYKGNVQFGLIQRAKNIADVSGSNGFESDNNGNGTSALPQTAAIFSNITLIGPYQGKTFSGINANYQNGIQIRRNSSISIHNSIIAGYPTGLYLDNTKGEPTSANISRGTLQFKNNIIAGCKDVLKTSTPYTLDEMTLWYTSNNNTTLESTDLIGLIDAYKFSPSVGNPSGRPDFRISASSVAISGASFSGLTGFQTVKYIGAFDNSNDWTLGWTDFDADNTPH